ncbi:MAG: TatD family hydrolase [Ottowia sp.]|nr:TatD family hydrolase [Ottowia sp.]
MPCWIDTHCHLDAPELAAHRPAVRAAAAAAGVRLCVIPAVAQGNFEAVRAAACEGNDAYALGLHPLYVAQHGAAALEALEAALAAARGDARLVAIGEIGLDAFVPALRAPEVWQRQLEVLRAQLRLARRFALPVLLHTRRAVDAVLHELRRTPVPGGIAHAFSGSAPQAQAFLNMGFKLGFGGACTFPRATRLRQLAASLPAESIVMETDAPDIPPHWRYVDAAARAAGKVPPPNTPAELPRIGAEVAALRGVSAGEWARQSSANALAALPRLTPLLDAA